MIVQHEVGIVEKQKLSALIRRGAQVRPQAFKDYVQKVPLGGGWDYEDRTCALGAAYEAITGQLPQPDWLQHGRVSKTIYNATDIKDVRLPYPEGVSSMEGSKDYIIDMVVALNDTFQWSREQIADYLESQGY